jgi:hypothetical protein
MYLIGLQDGTTLLQVAIKHGYHEVVKQLQDHCRQV